jgi:serine/threonine protein kinase
MPYQDYQIMRELKSGGTSQVYQVRDTDTGEHRVMKVTDFQVIQKQVWQNEVKILQEFQYVRGVVKMYEYGERQDLQGRWYGYTLLEFCDDDLFEHPIAPHEVQQIFRFVFDMLQTIHTLGYCYCDLKLENILRKGKGFRLCDFSSCQPIGSLTTIMYGTPHLMAPEIVQCLQANKEYYYDEKIDTWGFGCVLYEILTGDQFDRQSKQEQLESLKNPALRSVIQSCWQDDPLQRARLTDLAECVSVFATVSSKKTPAAAADVIPGAALVCKQQVRETSYQSHPNYPKQQPAHQPTHQSTHQSTHQPTSSPDLTSRAPAATDVFRSGQRKVQRHGKTLPYAEGPAQVIVPSAKAKHSTMMLRRLRVRKSVL